MLNLAPDLAMEPYDSAKKGWDDRHRRDLTKLYVSSSRYEGKVYGEMVDPPPQRFAKRSNLDPFFDAFQVARGAAVDSGWLSRQYVEDAEKVLSETDGKSFRHAVDGVPVSVAILAGQAYFLTRR
ncbi:hypothetical protein [Nesterenkonia alkaliphila]|uniref:hypothetical protein n=1 Tax=Nesterenkonia alkaliphila TaxID=1463631 RepID=UPI001662CAAE|nr:hypothetical protein [Nesterenkonia alkaliphila]